MVTNIEEFEFEFEEFDVETFCDRQSRNLLSQKSEIRVFRNNLTGYLFGI